MHLQLVHEAARIDVPAVNAPPRESPIPIRFGPACRLPRIGLGMASHGRPLSPLAQSRLSVLRLDHLRVDLALDCDDFGSVCKRPRTKPDSSAQHCTWLSRWTNISANCSVGWRCVRSMSLPIAAWLIHGRGPASASPTVLPMARKALGRVTPSAAFATGTNANFAELNRGRPPRELADWIFYSINPQVHAFDDDSLIDTLAVQADTVTSARRFTGDARIAVSTVTLRPRFNAVATGPEAPRPAGELPWQVDPRQATLFAAGWTLGSLAALARAGADFVTYFETTGWRGVIELEEGCELPDRFPSTPGCVFPVYHVLADLAAVTDSEVRPVVLDDRWRVHGLAVFGRERRQRSVGQSGSAAPDGRIAEGPAAERHMANANLERGQSWRKP